MKPLPRHLLALVLVVPAVSGLARGADDPPDDRPAGREVVDSRELPVHEMQRTDEGPTIDGRLDEAVWESAVPIEDFRQTEPVEGGVPSERTQVLLLFDAEYLYVAFRCFDREPALIRATQMRRDANLNADDRISFVIDPWFDRRNGYFFEMNPVGAKGDALIEDNTRFRREWDGIWYGRASMNEEGWVAEMAIPFETISFNPRTTQWSFNAMRFIRRQNESVRWASPSRDVSFNSMADAGIIDGIRDITQGYGIDIQPYAITTLKRDHDRDRDGVDADAGLDVFYKFTPTLTLALTINTDFAETEVDERRINLTRFPLFFPEKRDFFLQDAGIFEFGGIRRNPLPFFSRRIGLGADGETRDILAGVKLTGRVEGLNLGLLDVQMKHDSDLGNKNLFVGRASVNVLDQSTIGGIFTYGDPQTPDENILGGLDFNYRNSQFAGDRTLAGNVWWQHSESSNTGGENAVGAKLNYPNDRIRWDLGFTHIDEEFDAALGFVPRRGIREYFGGWRYRWRPESDVIRSIDSGVRAFVVTNLDDDVESRDLDFEVLAIETQFGDEFGIDFSREREVLEEPFEIDDGVVLPVDDYRFDRYRAGFESSAARAVGLGLAYEGGDFYSGTRDDYEIGFDWRVSRHLTLNLQYEMNDVTLDEGDFIARIIRGRVNVYFTPDLSWTTLVQYDNDSDVVGVNSRVRWIVQPGNEMFFVLNQAIDRDGTSFRVTQTEMTTKVGWTLRF